MPVRALEAGAAAVRAAARRHLRRARAALRLHARTVVPVVLAVGIALMVMHWR